MRLSTRKKLLFSCAALLLLAGSVEIVARVWLALRPRATSSNGPVEFGPYRRGQPLRYELVPGSRVFANGQIASINRTGLRGPELSEPKSRLRVLCLGDSCTFGFARDVTDDKTYPALLGGLLEQQFPGRFEVLNGGMPNFGTLDCLNFLMVRGLEFQPDVVVIYCGWNDLHHVHGLYRSPPSPALDRLALVKLARRLVKRPARNERQDILKRLSALPPHTGVLNATAFDRTERLLEEMVHICRRHGAEPLLVTLPNFTRPDWTDAGSLSDDELRLMEHHLTYWNASPAVWHAFATRTNAAIASIAERHRATLVDGSTINQSCCFVDAYHLNAEGNTHLARMVSAILAAGPDGSALRSDERDSSAD